MTWLLRTFRRLVRGRDDIAAAVAAFAADRAALLGEFHRTASEGGTPRGLAWVAVEPDGDPVFVRERDAGRLVALVPVVVRFEPVPGSDLEDVPQSREPRPVVALFAFEGGAWRTVGRAVFNLSAAELVERSGGRFVPLSFSPLPFGERG